MNGCQVLIELKLITLPLLNSYISVNVYVGHADLCVKLMWSISSQIWYYTNGILREAGFAENILPYITLSTGATETLAAIISVSPPGSLNS